MIFAIHLLDRPELSEILRDANRPEHLACLQRHAEHIAFAGPLRDRSERIVGSLLVLDFDDRDAAFAWLGSEPFNQMGLYASISVHRFENRWTQRVGYPAA